jgi:DNA-binding NarL/FixJ family response regulator
MTDDKKQNPWRLTPRQCAVLRALTEVGTVNGAAARLGLSSYTAEDHLRLAKRAMGVDNTIRAVLEWDRYIRGDRQPVACSVFQFRGWSGDDAVARKAA